MARSFGQQAGLAAAPLGRAGRSCRSYRDVNHRGPRTARPVEDGRGGRLRRGDASAQSRDMKRRKAKDVRTPGGATQPARPNYEHGAPCPRPDRLPRAASPQVGRTPGISCEAVPACCRGGAGMRRHVHAGNHAAESFVSFIPLFDGQPAQPLPCDASLRMSLRTLRPHNRSPTSP